MTSPAVVVVGLNYRSAPVELLERLAVPEDDADKALDQLMNYDHVLEGVLLSTCNRVEVYAAVSKFHGGAQDLRNFLAEVRHVAPEDFSHDLYTYHDDNAVRHLFRVAAGIDSMIVGESEILGQVRRAYRQAVERDAAGRVLSEAFVAALRVGKRARTETAIGRDPVSVSSAAVELARRSAPQGRLSGRRVTVVGTGKMGELAARALKQAGVADVALVNRTESRAQTTAAHLGARVRPFEELGAALAESDIVISSTTAPETLVTKSMLQEVVASRVGQGSLVIVDIAVPRDVEPDARYLDGIVLHDIDDLRSVVDAGVGNRMAEVAAVEGIIAAELERFASWQRSTEVGPTASALVERAEAIRSEELSRAGRALARLTDEQRALVDRVTDRIVSRLLHTPLQRVRELSGSRRGHDYLTALRELFDLDHREEAEPAEPQD